MAYFSRLMVRTILGALVLAPAAAYGQSSAPAGVQFNGSEDKKAARQIPPRAVPSSAASSRPRRPVRRGRSNLAQAQVTPDPGRVRIQSQDRKGYSRLQGRTVVKPPAPLPAPPSLNVGIRNQMRKFIQSISKFTRRYNQNFGVVTQGGLELLIKRDPVVGTRISPARAYIRSIDGEQVAQLDFARMRCGIFVEARGIGVEQRARVFGQLRVVDWWWVLVMRSRWGLTMANLGWGLCTK